MRRNAHMIQDETALQHLPRCIPTGSKDQTLTQTSVLDCKILVGYHVLTTGSLKMTRNDEVK